MAVSGAMLAEAARRRHQQNLRDQAVKNGQDTSEIDAKIAKYTKSYEQAWSDAHGGKAYPVTNKNQISAQEKAQREANTHLIAPGSSLPLGNYAEATALKAEIKDDDTSNVKRLKDITANSNDRRAPGSEENQKAQSTHPTYIFSTSEHGFVPGENDLVAAPSYDEQLAKRQQELAEKKASGQEVNGLEEIWAEQPGLYVQAGPGRVQSGLTHTVEGKPTYDEREIAASTMNPDGYLASSGLNILPQLAETVETGVGFIRNLPQLLRDANTASKNYKLVVPSTGKTVDESDLMNQLGDYVEKYNNGELQHYWYDVLVPGTDQVVMSIDASELAPETDLNNQEEVSAQLNDIVQSHLDPNGYTLNGVDMPVVDDAPTWEFSGNFSTDDLTMPDGSTVSWDEIQELQENFDKPGVRYNMGQDIPILDFLVGDNTQTRDQWYQQIPDMLAYTAPYMFKPLAIPTVAADMITAAQGLDPFSYDPVTQTYADPGVQTAGDYASNLGQTAAEDILEFALGGLTGEKGLASLFGKANTVRKGATKGAQLIDDPATAMQKYVKEQGKGVLKRGGKVVKEEAIEEGVQQTAGEAARQLESDNGGWFADQVGVDDSGNAVYDENTSQEHRINNAVSQIGQAMAWGGALGGILGAPGVISQRNRDRRMLNANDTSGFEKFRTQHLPGSYITPERRRAIEAGEEPSWGERRRMKWEDIERIRRGGDLSPEARTALDEFVAGDGS